MASVCTYTHQQLLTGHCPFCGELVGKSNSIRRWRLAVVNEHLRHRNPDVRTIAVVNSTRSDYPITSDTGGLEGCLDDEIECVSYVALMGVILRGHELTSSEWEHTLDAFNQRSDRFLQSLLILGYGFWRKYDDQSIAKARADALVYCIMHHPLSAAHTAAEAWAGAGCDTRFAEFCDAWRSVLRSRPEDALVLKHANNILMQDPALCSASFNCRFGDN